MSKSKPSNCNGCGTRNCTKASVEQTNKWEKSACETADSVAKSKNKKSK
ncbi:MAG: hypothetical protein J5755_06470 [Clostridia bacterium]|nr:hypothetical protein [Clostridia bacterium]